MAKDNENNSEKQMSEEEEKVYRMLFTNEVKSKVSDRINASDPAFIKTLKIFLDDEEPKKKR
jgi:hypothetical protein